MKRVIALLTAIVMIVTAFSFTVSVSAAEDATQTPSESVSSVATEESESSETVATSESESESTEPSESATSTEPTESESSTEPTESTPQETENTTDESESTAPTETESVKPTTPAVKKPSAVSSFKVIKKADDFIKLEWKKNKKADKYVLYRAVENKNSEFNFKLYKKISKKNSTYVDRDVTTGKVYKYRLYVVTVNKGKEIKSAAKGVATFTPLLATGKLKVKDSSASKITTAWRKIKNASKYEIYRKTEGSKDYTKIATTSNTKYSDKKVKSGVIYAYKVRGYRTAAGKKRYSPFVKVYACADEFSVKSVSSKSYLRRALLTWTAVSGVDGYDIFICKDNGDEVYEGSTTSSTVNYLTKRLKSGKTYTFNVKAFQKVGKEKIHGEGKKTKIKIVSTAYGKAPGKTYVEVCVETQTVNMVVNGKQYVETPVVTGMYHVYDTTKGFHRVISKKSPARLRGSAGGSSWDVGVSYWLGFTWDGQGLHDSTWRYSGYGGNVYKGDGSHGCVNTPYSAMSKIFSKAYAGMPVIVY